MMKLCFNISNFCLCLFWTSMRIANKLINWWWSAYTATCALALMISHLFTVGSLQQEPSLCPLLQHSWRSWKLSNIPREICCVFLCYMHSQLCWFTSKENRMGTLIPHQNKSQIRVHKVKSSCLCYLRLQDRCTAAPRTEGAANQLFYQCWGGSLAGQ